MACYSPSLTLSSAMASSSYSFFRSKDYMFSNSFCPFALSSKGPFFKHDHIFSAVSVTSRVSSLFGKDEKNKLILCEFLGLEVSECKLGFISQSSFSVPRMASVDAIKRRKRTKAALFDRKRNSIQISPIPTSNLSTTRNFHYKTEKEGITRNVTCEVMGGGPLFEGEAIGAEHGEGFATFRSRGPLHVDVDFLNDRMKERGLQRIRFAMRPDEAFGLIYSLDNVLVDTRALKMEAWKRLALEEDRNPSEVEASQKHIQGVAVERAIRQVLAWTRSESEVSRLTKRLTEIYCPLFSQVKAPVEGAREWLQAMHRERVPCAVASSLDRVSLLAALSRMGLSRYFCAYVTEEDGMESMAHRFLSAAVKLDRPPAKCVVFEDDPRGVAAAHNCSMKAIALIGTHPAYELKQADLTVSKYTELSVINLRRLFAARGLEFMDLQKQAEDKKPPKRRTRNDTLF